MIWLSLLFLLAIAHIAIACFMVVLIMLIRQVTGFRSAAFAAKAWFFALCSSILLTPLGFVPWRPESEKLVLVDRASVNFSVIREESVSDTASLPIDPETLSTLAMLVAATWLLGTIVALLDLGLALFQSRRLRSEAYEAVHLSASSLPVWPERLRLMFHPNITSPMLTGWRRPVVLMPTSSFNLDPDLNGVLAHERAHHERNDVIGAFFQRLAVAVVWWSPPARFISRRLSLARERACDDLAAIDDRFGYARGLARIATPDRQKTSREIEQRVRRLIAPGAIPPQPTPIRDSLRLVMTAAIALAAILSLAPQWIVLDRSFEGNWTSAD